VVKPTSIISAYLNKFQTKKDIAVEIANLPSFFLFLCQIDSKFLTPIHTVMFFGK
jgi:hypothetical protein